MNRNSKHKSCIAPIIVICVCSAILFLIVGYIVVRNFETDTVPEQISVDAGTTPSPMRSETPTTTPTPDATPYVSPVPAADVTAEPQWQFDAFSDHFWMDGVLTRETEYRSPSLSVIYRRVYDTETFHRRLTYFTAEIFASDVTQIRTASFKGDFNKRGHGDVEDMAIKNNALVAISGDYYGFHGDSLVIRNGEVYRAKLRSGDICLLLRDGTMETLRSKDASIEQILDKDPWQAWQFGPMLLTASGEARTSFPDSSLNSQNPRSCIGYIEPGHYFFVVVDGRQKFSRGLTLSELAELMESLGCVQAFNLDGGASAHFFWDGHIVSNPSGGGREISDIIYIAKENYPVSPYFPGKDGLSE